MKKLLLLSICASLLVLNTGFTKPLKPSIVKEKPSKWSYYTSTDRFTGQAWSGWRLRYDGQEIKIYFTEKVDDKPVTPDIVFFNFNLLSSTGWMFLKNHDLDFIINKGESRYHYAGEWDVDNNVISGSIVREDLTARFPLEDFCKLGQATSLEMRLGFKSVEFDQDAINTLKKLCQKAKGEDKKAQLELEEKIKKECGVFKVGACKTMLALYKKNMINGESLSSACDGKTVEEVEKLDFELLQKCVNSFK